MRLQSLTTILTFFSLCFFYAVATSPSISRRDAYLKQLVLADAQEALHQNLNANSALLARSLDEVILRRIQRRSNGAWLKSTGVVKDTPGPRKRCKGDRCTPKEMKTILAEDKKTKGTECKQSKDCKCPPGKYGTSCLNGKCLCGDANKPVAAAGNFFVKVTGEGLKKGFEEMAKIFGTFEAALKMAIKIGSWVIPGLGPETKAVMKAVDAVMPPGKFQTGNKKADEVLNTIAKVI